MLYTFTCAYCKNEINTTEAFGHQTICKHCGHTNTVPSNSPTTNYVCNSCHQQWKSNSISVCPKCSSSNVSEKPVDNSETVGTIIGISMALIVTICIVLSGSKAKNEAIQKVTEQPAIKISLSELQKELLNPIAAEQKYMNKLVETQGKISIIGEYCETTLISESGESIQCHFITDNSRILAKYNVGENLKIKGTLKSKSEINDCVIINNAGYIDTIEIFDSQLKTPEIVNLIDVYNEYKLNNKRAQLRYHQITFEGKVKKIDKTILGSVYVIFETGSIGELECYFDDEKDLLQLKIDESYQIKGILSATYKFHNVKVIKAKTIKNLSALQARTNQETFSSAEICLKKGKIVEARQILSNLSPEFKNSIEILLEKYDPFKPDPNFEFTLKSCVENLKNNPIWSSILNNSVINYSFDEKQKKVYIHIDLYVIGTTSQQRNLLCNSVSELTMREMKSKGYTVECSTIYKRMLPE